MKGWEIMELTMWLMRDYYAFSRAAGPFLGTEKIKIIFINTALIIQNNAHPFLKIFKPSDNQYCPICRKKSSERLIKMCPFGLIQSLNFLPSKIKLFRIAHCSKNSFQIFSARRFRPFLIRCRNSDSINRLPLRFARRNPGHFALLSHSPIPAFLIYIRTDDFMLLESRTFPV